jgi:hypothetical protein
MERTVMKRPLDKELRQTIEKRNRRLSIFFSKIGLNDIEIVGDMETPAVVKQNYCLSCYVHNFNLIFTSHYDQGTELYRIKLQKEQEYDIATIENWLQTATHRRIYRIKIKNLDMYLVGYNFRNKETPEDKYPVFGRYSSKIYFTEDYAQDLINLYQLDYCEII